MSAPPGSDNLNRNAIKEEKEVRTVSTHSIAIHTIGDILMLVGVLGVVLWLVASAPWSRSRRPAYRDDAPADEVPPTDRYPADRHYQDEYRRSGM